MKSPRTTLSRRRFLTQSTSSVSFVAAATTALAATAGPVAAAAGPATIAAETPSPAPPAVGVSMVPPFLLFTKHLLGMEPAALADHVGSLGFYGVEAPIRPGGHIEPEKTADELPAFVETLAKANLKLTILTSGINEISTAQHTETVLRSAAKLGIPYYRLNWFKYDLKKPIPPQLDEFHAKIKDLIALSRELGIRPLSQNHNGRDYVGAAIWDLESIMRGHDPKDWGFAYDIMHGSIVGGTSWESAYHLARPRIGVAYFKDFTWRARLKPEPCPLGAGFAAGPEYARLLRGSQFSGPVCLHVEYLKAEKITNSREAELAHASASKDLATLKNWWSA
ncbi:MAG: Xylose isomerase-like barrel [Verrucomicrobiales bacterium]|nr:Xylose isomerase-like barrel [Verrucomicrobiales bacterium]